MKLNCLEYKSELSGQCVIFNGEGTFKIYLPKSYFEKGDAVELADKIETLGIFICEYNNKRYKFKLPVKFRFEYTTLEKFKGKLSNELMPDDYNVYGLVKGNKFITDTNHVQDLEDLEYFMKNRLFQGSLPEIISYPESYELLLNLLLFTNTNAGLNVSSTMYELILAELYRNKNNLNEPFRLKINGNKQYDKYGYKMVGLRKLPSLHSTFNALIGEDSYQQILNAVLRHRQGEDVSDSPLEKLLKI